MPIKKQTLRRKPKTRKRATTRKTSLVRPSRLAFPDSVFPPQKYVTMKFAESGALTTGTTQNLFGDNRLFLLNAIFAPKVSSPQFRAQGFDQIKSIYKRHKVWGAKVSITFSNPSIDGLWVGFRPAQHDNVDYISAEYLGPSLMKRWTVCKPINNTGSQVVKYTRMFNIANLQGLTKDQFSADNGDYVGTETANPTKAPYIEFTVCNTASTVSATIVYQIQIEYIVQLYDRQVLTNSGTI